MEQNNRDSEKDSGLTLSVFDTQLREEELRALVEGLDCSSNGCFVLRVCRQGNRYVFFTTSDGREGNYNNVRVVQNQVWTGSYAGTIDSMLRSERVPYKVAKVRFSMEELTREGAVPVSKERYLPKTGWEITPF